MEWIRSDVTENVGGRCTRSDVTDNVGGECTRSDVIDNVGGMEMFKVRYHSKCGWDGSTHGHYECGSN